MKNLADRSEIYDATCSLSQARAGNGQCVSQQSANQWTSSCRNMLAMLIGFWNISRSVTNSIAVDGCLAGP